MKRKIVIFCLSFFVIFILDRVIKMFILKQCGWNTCLIWQSDILSLVLVFNRGVAFSLLSFLGEGLKYLQVLLLMGVVYWLFKYGRDLFIRHAMAFGFIIAGGMSNILDRFVYGGVVDYVYWHFYFEFAVFNFADVMIDVGVGLVILAMLYDRRKASSSLKK